MSKSPPPPPKLSLLQAFRFADTDQGHVDRLLAWAELPPNSRIVDLGAGAGFVASRMYERRPDLSFCLVDKNQARLDKADGRFRRHCADICEVPEPDASFDALICCYAIGYADADRFFREACRLVRPGGVAFIVDMVPAPPDSGPRVLFGYAISGRSALEASARSAGLAVDFYLEPTDDSGWGETQFPGFFEIFFGDVRPAIWRFTRP